MNQKWWTKFGWWFCQKIGHPMPEKAWIYRGYYHRSCRWCNRIVSEPLKAKFADDIEAALRSKNT